MTKYPSIDKLVARDQKLIQKGFQFACEGRVYKTWQGAVKRAKKLLFTEDEAGFGYELDCAFIRSLTEAKHWTVERKNEIFVTVTEF